MAYFCTTIEEAQEIFFQLAGVADATPGATADGWTLEEGVRVIMEDGTAEMYAVYDSPREIMLAEASGAR